MDTFRDLKKLRPLADLLPLSAPFGLHIDPCNACNFACTFCPTGDNDLLKSVARPKGSMPLDLFQKIIDDATAFEAKIKRLHLYKDGEPYVNKKLEDMIAYAVKREVSLSVETTTNGALLSEERAIKTIESGLNTIRISIEHVHDEGYHAVTGKNVKYRDIREKVEFLFAEKNRRNSHLKIHAKIVDFGLTDEEKKTFISDFESISDSINIDSPMGWDGQQKDWALGADPDTAMDGKTPINKDILVCAEPFKNMAVNFNGEVSVCCVDWSHGAVVGDLTVENLVDIWNGDRINEFRRTHLQGHRKDILVCANCQYVQGTRPSSYLDEMRETLLPVYSR